MGAATEYGDWDCLGIKKGSVDEIKETEESMRIDYYEEGEPIDRLNSLITIFQDLQNEVALLSDELDSETLENAEGAIDTVIELLGDAILENEGEVY